MIKSCVVVGAGNAGRPVARLLNHKGVKVTITDSKEYDSFSNRRKSMLDVLKDEGVVLELGVENPDISQYDAIFLAPTIPESAPIRKEAEKYSLEVIDGPYISKLINEILSMPKIGITGSYGKTTTTTLLTNIFQSAGYKVYNCSSMKWNLVSEAIMDDIVNGEHEGADIAVLELPHGTLGLLCELDLEVGAITNLHNEHLCEFEDDIHNYVERKSIMLSSCKKAVTNIQCAQYINDKRDDIIYYDFEDKFDKNSEGFEPAVVACVEDGKYYVNLLNENTGKINIELDTIANFNYENLTGAITIARTYGLSMDEIIKGIANFTGVGGRMEFTGEYGGVKTYYDAGAGDLPVRQALETIKDENLIIVYDNVDSTMIRDKKEAGRVIGEYASIVIATGYNEITDELDMNSPLELLGAIENDEVLKMAVCMIDEASELAMKYSKPGDIIVHLGPGALHSYQEVKDKFIKGLEEGSKRYGTQ